MNDELLLTGSGLLSFLTQIEELSGLAIGINRTDDDRGFEVTIGDNTYNLTPLNDAEIEVSPEVVEDLQDINLEGYDILEGELGEDYTIEEEPIEGGIIKELIKTLAIGGLVRMTKNAIEKA